MRALTFALTTAVLMSAAQAGAANLIHDYSLNDATDALGGPSLTGAGTFTDGTYVFGSAQGLTLTNALPTLNTGDYSIYLRVSFDDVGGYKRYVDFKDYGSDTGFYNLGGSLNFYNVVTGPPAVIVAGTFHDIVITRDDASDVVAGYVDGVQQWTFVDSGALAVFTATDGVMHFFQDDNQVGGEQGPGTADRIQIYTGALTAEEVAAIPEPAALAPALIAGSALLRRRR